MASNQFASLADRVEDLAEDIDENSNDAARDSLESETKEVAGTELEANDTNWRYQIWLSLNVDTEELSRTSTRHTLGLRGVDFNRQYPVFVEFGTGYHFGESPFDVPSDIPRFDAPSFSPQLIDAIYEWVQTKNGGLTPLYYNTQRELAGAIAMNISEDGTRAQPFMRAAFEYTWRDIVKHVKRDVRRAIRRI